MLIILFFGFQLDASAKEAIVKAFNNLETLQVRFEQETYSDFFDPTEASGLLQIQRPGRMRMEYQKGERKVFIWDGTTCYEKDFDADTETRTDQTEVKDEPLVKLLLYGSQVDRLFLVDRYKREPDKKEVFRFRPRQQDDYTIEVIFDANWLPIYIEVAGNDGEGTRLWLTDHDLTAQFEKTTFAIPK